MAQFDQDNMTEHKYIKLVTHDIPFVMVAKSIPLDRRLSLKAKGLLMVLLNFATLKNWKFSHEHLESLSTDKEHSYRTALNELKQKDYITISLQKDNRGRFSHYQWIISNGLDNPFNLNVDSPQLGDSTIRKITPLNNTDSSKNDINNTKIQSDKKPSDPLNNNLIKCYNQIWKNFKTVQKLIDPNSTTTSYGVKHEGFTAFKCAFNRSMFNKPVDFEIYIVITLQMIKQNCLRRNKYEDRSGIFIARLPHIKRWFSKNLYSQNLIPYIRPRFYYLGKWTSDREKHDSTIKSTKQIYENDFVMGTDCIILDEWAYKYCQKTDQKTFGSLRELQNKTNQEVIDAVDPTPEWKKKYKKGGNK